jgi:hypothetical protein
MISINKAVSAYQLTMWSRCIGRYGLFGIMIEFRSVNLKELVLINVWSSWMKDKMRMGIMLQVSKYLEHFF